MSEGSKEGERGGPKEIENTSDRFGNLFDRVPVGLYRSTPEGEVLDANQAMLEMLGCPDLDTLKEMGVGRFYVDDAIRRDWKERMAREGVVRNFVSQARRLDGGIIWLRDNSRAIRNDSGDLLCFEGSIEDITEATMIENALRESEEMFRLLSEQSLLGIAILQDGTFSYFNHAAANIFGHNVESMLKWGPDDFERFIHPEDREFVMGQARKKQEGDEDVVNNYQFRIITKGGDTKWVDIYSKTIVYGGGTADLVTFIDITGRRWAEDALSTSVRQWVTTFDSMSDAVSLLDEDGVIIQCNRATAKLIGRPFTEIIGANCYELFREPGGPAEGCPMGEVLKTRTRASQVIRKGDRWLLITIDPIFDDDREMTGAVHIVSDITERQEAEERTKAALREKEVMLKEIHHRVKNNLQVISSMLNLQGGLGGDAPLEELYRDSQNRIRSMALVHEKLYRSEDLARIELLDYIDTLVSGLKRSYMHDGWDISIEMNVDDIHLSIDSAIPCGLIINELVSNSMKHAFPDGRSGCITIGFTRSGDKGMTLTMRDDGVGMPAGVDPREMESMGMMLVRTLVEQLEGSIEVMDGPGAGYRIEFDDVGKEGN